jgi:hypothetical protein
MRPIASRKVMPTLSVGQRPRDNLIKLKGTKEDFDEYQVRAYTRYTCTPASPPAHAR